MPFFIGKAVSTLPYDYRPGIGRLYRQRKLEIKALAAGDSETIKNYVFTRVKRIVEYAYINIPFYRDLYKSKGINPREIRTLNDLNSLPIISKSILQDVPLEMRSAKVKGRMLENTGGSSGQPLEFYIEPSSVPHEWAHMHEIWSHLGFAQNRLKIVFAGRANVRGAVEYDSARHSLVVNIYKGWQSVADSLEPILIKRTASFLHGYPSAIFDFVLWLESNRHPLLSMLQGAIKGMFLGSEMPDNEKRWAVEGLLGCGSISWYGHTERAVLAYEKTKHGEYFPFPSYGFAEAVKSDEGYKLVATSYYNRASPFIRYDTGDYISPVFKSGLMESFSIAQGREGDFILDKNMNKIFLTALIFGRHHELFKKAAHIQVGQKEQGRAQIFVVPRTDISSEEAAKLFDASNVAIDFEFMIIQEPYRTISGKVPLIVKDS